MCGHPLDPFYMLFDKYYLALADLYSNLLFFNVKYVTNKFYDILLTKIKKCK